MPELPEVETVRRGLNDCIVGRRVARVDVIEGKSFLGDVGDVEGREVVRLGRRGKALLIELSGDVVVMVHLRMTGQLVFVGDGRFAGGHPTGDFVGELPSRHTRVVVEFEGGGKLYFNDQRKFGFMKVMRLKEVEEDGFIKKLGPEPWDFVGGGLDFYEALQRRRNTSVKAAILDQSVVAGVGNIYADEGLHRAGIFPGRMVRDITPAEAGRLLRGICEVMEESLESGGSTMKNYVRADGTRGDYLEKFAKVFRREGEECGRCGGKVLKIRVAGRGTHYCPGCQK